MAGESMPQKTKVLPKDDYYRKYYWDLRKDAWNCTRCSCCKWIDSWDVKSARFAYACPSSARYLFDAYSCQGRMDIALALLDGKLQYSDSESLLDIIYKCDTCGNCDASCKRVQDLQPLKVMLEIRAKLVEDGHFLPAHKAVIDGLKKENNMMQRPRSQRGNWTMGLKAKDLTKEKAKVAYHAGCLLSYDEGLWKVARVAVTLLNSVGVDVGIMGQAEMCCGGRAYDMGYRADFTRLAHLNEEAFKKAGVDTVVVSCAGCYRAFKLLYPELGKKLKIVHILEYVDFLIKEGKIELTKKAPLKLTYHDPCRLGRLSRPYVPGESIGGIYEPPREILRAVPGVELVEMERIKESAWCCGAGGGVREAYPDFSFWTAAQRIEEAKATGAEAIVTACPWCMKNFADVIKKQGEKLRVYDVLQVVQKGVR